MRSIAVTLIALSGLSACSDAQISPIEKPDKVSTRDTLCGADQQQDLIGKTETALKGISFDGPVRIIHPGTAVTKDYRTNRINFDIDENGIITRIYCG